MGDKIKVWTPVVIIIIGIVLVCVVASVDEGRYNRECMELGENTKFECKQIARYLAWGN